MPPHRPIMVELRLHGYPTLIVGGRPVACKLKRALALLARLADAGQPLGRQSLAEQLWPDADGATARARLRRLVHELNALAGSTLIEGDAHALWLSPTCRSDLQATARAIEAGDVEPLLAAGSEGVLEGFALDAEAFDDWLAGRRRQQRAALQRALEAAAQAALAGHDVARLQALGARLLQLDDCAESGHAARLRERALSGDAAGVESAYHAAAQRLREELGVRPSARLEAAYAQAQALLRQAVAVPVIDYVDSGHGEVAHACWGRAGGEAIVVLWGLVGNIDVAFDEPRARAVLDRLAQRHRVVMLDRRGTGLSERVGVVADAEEGARDIVATLDHLGIERAWLFGSSVGGTIALDFALRHPERTAGLLLFGTSASGAWAPDWPWALRRERFDDWIACLTDPALYDCSLRRFAPSAADDPAVRAWYARLLRNAATRRGAVASLRAYQAMDLRRRVGAIGVPTLVMQCRDDRIVPFEAGRWLARAIPGASFAPLEGADHFLWHGDAAAVADTIEGFVRSHARAAPALAA